MRISSQQEVRCPYWGPHISKKEKRRGRKAEVEQDTQACTKEEKEEEEAEADEEAEDEEEGTHDIPNASMNMAPTLTCTYSGTVTHVWLMIGCGSMER